MSLSLKRAKQIFSCPDRCARSKNRPTGLARRLTPGAYPDSSDDNSSEAAGQIASGFVRRDRGDLGSIRDCDRKAAADLLCAGYPEELLKAMAIEAWATRPDGIPRLDSW